jgi:nanoRNase/pAp phosphatase (c-di-AMP/oligoRNAs hydrolase)
LLEKFFKTRKQKKILILTHAGCDVDAIASAGALYFCFKKRQKISIGVPDHLNVFAKSLAEKLKVPFSINPGLEGIDALVLVDFNSFKMLGSMEQAVRDFKKPILLIDHHSKSTDKITKDIVLDSTAVATTEIVFKLLKKSKTKLSQAAAICIVAGIITDSANFLVAGKETFSIMSVALKETKKPFAEISSFFSVEQDISEKIAKLKAAKRVRIFKVSDFIVATTSVGCFEADAASALVRLGADIAFAGDVDNGKLKISARASNSFVRRTSFNLAKNVIERLEESFSGSGGGHAAAAAFNGKAETIESALQKCVELSQEFIKAKTGNSETKEYD